MPSSASLSEPFTFLQMNFWDGRLAYPINTLFNREQADIFSAQEMLSGAVDLSAGFLTAEVILKRGYFDRVAFGGSILFMRLKDCDFTTSVATFVKSSITIENETIHPLYQNPDDSSQAEKDKARYNSLLHTTLRLKDGFSIHVLNHHGRLVISDDGRLRSPVADYNFKAIADYAAKLKGPIILSGDFNLLKEASSLQPLKDIGLVNLNEKYNVAANRNEFAWKPEETVSHVFINDQIVVEDYRPLNDNVSDHLPLLLKARAKRS